MKGILVRMILFHPAVHHNESVFFVKPIEGPPHVVASKTKVQIPSQSSLSIVGRLDPKDDKRSGILLVLEKDTWTPISDMGRFL